MKELIAVEGWATVNESYKGKYRNEQGLGLCGFYRRDYKKSHEVVVLNNGHSLCRYKYPRGIDIPFHSPMVRWKNLTFCGGYGVRLENGEEAGSDVRLVEAVANGLKPIGFIIVDSNKVEGIVERIKRSGLHFSVTEAWSDRYEIGLANPRRIKDHFDINDLISSYRLYSHRLGYDLLTSEDEALLLKAIELELAYFINGFDYANAQKEDWEHVLTGLLLGYPIESTVAFLSGQISQ